MRWRFGFGWEGKKNVFFFICFAYSLSLSLSVSLAFSEAAKKEMGSGSLMMCRDTHKGGSWAGQQPTNQQS